MNANILSIDNIITLLVAIPAAIGVIFTIIISWRNRINIHELHLSINSRLDEWLKMTQLASFAEVKATQEAAEKAKQAAAAAEEAKQAAATAATAAAAEATAAAAEATAAAAEAKQAAAAAAAAATSQKI